MAQFEKECDATNKRISHVAEAIQGGLDTGDLPELTNSQIVGLFASTFLAIRNAQASSGSTSEGYAIDMQLDRRLRRLEDRLGLNDEEKTEAEADFLSSLRGN